MMWRLKKIGKGVVVSTIMSLLEVIIMSTSLYFFISLILSFSPANITLPECKRDKEIFISTNGIHVDIIIPVHVFEPEFPEQLHILPTAEYIAFGWGDKNFYINTPEWKYLTFSVAFKALFLKSETAMHVTFYPGKGRNWKSIHLCDQQLRSLIVYIRSTFIHDQHGQLQKMDFEGYNEYDVFFDAKGSFSLFFTCNTWVNNGFKKSSVRTAVWTPFDLGVLYHIN